MASLSIDTYKAVALLQEHGYSKQQAEGFVAVLQNADLADIATRADVADLKGDVQAVRVEMYKVAAGQTLVIMGAMVALAQVL